MKQMHLVFIHGWGIGSYCWQPCLGALSTHFKVHCVDLPGYNGTQESALGFEETAAHIAAACPPESILCGWSLGSLIAMQAALIKPRHIRSLVLVGATPCFMERSDWRCAQSQAVLKAFGESVEKDPSATLRRFTALFNQNDNRSREITRSLNQQMQNAPAISYHTLAQGFSWLGEVDLRKEVGAIDVPVCLIHGQNDSLMPTVAVEWLQSHLKEACLHLVAGAAHAPFLNNPDLFVQTVSNHCHELCS